MASAADYSRAGAAARPALNLEWREDRLRAAIDAGMRATDVAVEAAIAGVPFHDHLQGGRGRRRFGRAGRDAGRLAGRASPGAAADHGWTRCTRACRLG